MKILLSSKNFRSTISATMISKRNFNPHDNAFKKIWTITIIWLNILERTISMVYFPLKIPCHVNIMTKMHSSNWTEVINAFVTYSPSTFVVYLVTEENYCIFCRHWKLFFDVIILTEIGARNLGLVEHLLPTHTFYHVTPDNNNWGGVGIYVSNEATDVIVRPEYELKKSCNCSKCEFESLFIALKLRSHRLTIGGIYRHPSGNI